MSPRQPEASTTTSCSVPAGRCARRWRLRFGPSATVPSTDLLRVARASTRPPSPGSWRASASTAPTSPHASSTAAGAYTSPRASAAVHDLLERLAVALAERRALRLAVVGEHHEVIGARRLRGRALETGELAIVALQHRQSIGLADSRVVGDLVVSDERRVADRHALDDVRHQQRRDEVAHDDRDRGADERVEAAPIDMRGAAAALADGLPGAPARCRRATARSCA